MDSFKKLGFAFPPPPIHENPEYCCVPVRAMKDARFGPGHHRTLQAICRRYGFGKNGKFCFAGHRKLSQDTCLHYTNLSGFTGDLVKWGYLGRHKNKNSYLYWVNYDDPVDE
ncbi:MAG: hypothetical protein IIB64_06010 [Proteobacteria bacterium]|nr:hypothetical protein [Pseudomonadota bacterium]